MEKKVFDLETMEFKSAPAGKDESEQKVADTVDKDESEDESEEAQEEESEEVEGEASETEDEEAAANEDEESDKDESDNETEEQEEVADIDDILKSRYSKEYEINSAEELDNVLKSIDKLMEQNEELKLQIENKKGHDLPEDVVKTAEWLNGVGYKPGNFADGVLTHATLVSMDIDNADGKQLLREKYIIEHPELTREESTRKFERYYNSKFVIDKEKFDDDDKLKDAIEDARIDEKSAVSKAKAFLKEQQSKTKVKNQNKQEDQEPQVSEAVNLGIKQTSAEYDKYLNKLDDMTFEFNNDKEDNYTFKFSPEQKKSVQAMVKGWVSNPINYSKDGRLKGDDASPEEWIQRATFALFGKDLVSKLHEHLKTIVTTKRVEDIEKVKPTRKGNIGGGNVKIEKSEDDKWMDTLKKVKQRRQQASRQRA